MRNASLIILVLLFFHQANAQVGENSGDDSTIIKQATNAFALAFTNSDSALKMAGQALAQAKRVKNDKAIANAYNSIGWAYLHKGHLDSSIFFLQKAWDIFSALKDRFDVVRVDINLAEVYTKQYKISTAINYLLQGDSIAVAAGNIPQQTDIKRQLAIIYRESGDQQKSAEYFKMALDGFEKQGDYFRYVNTGVSLSILYRNMRLYDSSINTLKRCLQIAKEKKGTPYQVAMTEENMAETYFSKKAFEPALQHYTLAYRIFEKLDNKGDLSYESFSVGKTYLQLKKYTDAEKFLLTSYAINDSLQIATFQVDAASELATLYKETGDFKKAYFYLQEAAQLKDSINFTEQKEKTNELKEKYETEKKVQEITLLKTKNELAAADNRRTSALQYLFIVLFAASIIIGWLLYNRLKIKRSLKEQVLRNQIARDLHDDIGSTLSSIDINSGLALLKKDDAAEVEKQLIKIKQQAKKTMDGMSDIVWSVNPHYDNFEHMLSKMKEFATELCEPKQVELQFNTTEIADGVILDAEKRKNMFLIFKEAINNAVKYSGCNLIAIDLLRPGRSGFVMRIHDNGSGFNAGTVKNGNGLRNMQQRAENMKGNLDITSERESGTTVELRFTF